MELLPLGRRQLGQLNAAAIGRTSMNSNKHTWKSSPQRRPPSFSGDDGETGADTIVKLHVSQRSQSEEHPSFPGELQQI